MTSIKVTINGTPHSFTQDVLKARYLEQPENQTAHSLMAIHGTDIPKAAAVLNGMRAGTKRKHLNAKRRNENIK
jgi:hypothetical protein